jgi:DNA-binding SARP family transcriptional activator
LGQALFAANRYAEAAENYRQALRRDDRETLHRELMRAYARQGEVGQALRHYQGLAERLRDELKTVPAAETQALYEKLRQGETI